MMNSIHLCCGSTAVKLHVCPGSVVFPSSMHLISVRWYCEGRSEGHWRLGLPSSEESGMFGAVWKGCTWAVSGHVWGLLLLSGGNGLRGWKRSATLLKLCWRAVLRPGLVSGAGSSRQTGCSWKSSSSIGIYGARVSRSRSLRSTWTQLDIMSTKYSFKTLDEKKNTCNAKRKILNELVQTSNEYARNWGERADIS